MPRKIVSVNVDETVHSEAKRLARKKGMSFSRLTEELLSKFVREEWRREEEEQRKVEQKLETEDKGKKLADAFMKKLLYDADYRSEEWTMVGY
jgi:antitoxin component of RelBE/YafQ-DinJ toxin-antitoxin module